LLDVMHVPTYARYIKDIINNMRPLPQWRLLSLWRNVALLYSTNSNEERRPEMPNDQLLDWHSTLWQCLV